eukprot:CAMPEP_0117419046 /NCGR_PEP_ID=MMETSP0758-20121206/704_1 /TAXON_ID=63605 /ORGANISM="Percolomonas cosmopolitus, Strain AE-1 (ATCC 50343)" /LENGTH=1291 /DNA_ID=CAMNT_0005199911 /DNA_START=513 /DNA_END=4388 /DNA_ORIENTATION=-
MILQYIGHSLDSLHNLEELNMGGCKIGRFKEIPHLDRLRSLRSLSLKCPNFGENPVCSLCNYQTYALYHLTNITKLDSLTVTEQARNLADATFLKKKMYYNMRIKTLKRNTSNVVKQGLSYMNARNNEINLNMNVLVRMQKEIEREFQELQHQATDEDEEQSEEEDEDDNFKKQLKAKYNMVLSHIETRNKEIMSIERQFNKMNKDINDISEHNIRRLMVELETGGNIRLEEGKQSDVWFRSCVDLVKSRFFPSDFEPYGISGLRVNRVTRIHNRFLRNRFENHLESLVDISDQSYKRSLEYLFFSSDQSNLFSIIEDGFPNSSHFEKSGQDAAVPLSNSVSVCELPRVINSRLDSKSKLKSGCLLIAKVFLGSFTHEQRSTSGKRNTGKRATKISQKKYPNYDSIYRIKSNDSKQRIWFIFDNKLILPEYLIEYEFVYPQAKEKPKYNPVDFILSEIKPQSDIDSMDVRSYAPQFYSFASFCQSLYDQDRDVCTATLNMPPVLKARPKIADISSDALLRVTNMPSLEQITYLNLYGNSLQKITGLGSLVNLKHLILSFNEIQTIEGLTTLVNLERLELGFNLIRRIEGIESLPNLKFLELCNNLIYRIEDINVLRKHVPQLEEINLKNNTLCEIPSYRYIIIRRMPNLLFLDESRILDDEREFAKKELNVLNEELLYKRHRGLETIDAEEAMESGWQQSIIDLNLESLRLRRIQQLENLTQLKRISFASNEISRIEGLTECMKLQELNLEDNRIIRLEGLSSLLSLRKLEIGKNKIAKLENLDLLRRLSQLSIEDNEIETLAGISKLMNLMELYVGNNKIKNLKEIHHLKKLPKLIILDLSGNELCLEKNYRLYCIYNLRKLKVLDGISIDSTEISKAKSEFSGKVTVDVLNEKIGALTNFRDVMELDLSSSGIKSISNLDGFTQLRDLNLEQNLVSNISGLENLTSLVILRLSSNRIDASHPSKNHSFGKYINKFTKLEILTLDSNHISSIASLQLYKLPNLRVLSLRSNEINKIEGLDGLYHLQELLLDKNKIRSIDDKAFSGCPNLRLLHIEENSLRTLDGLKDLPNLHSLFLGCNRIVELPELEKLAGLVRLKEIVLSYNPISKKSLYRPSLIHRVPSLLFIDCKEVIAEERERSMLFFAQDYFHSNSTIYGSADPRGSSGTVGQPTGNNPRLPVRISSVNFEYSKEGTNGSSMAPLPSSSTERNYSSSNSRSNSRKNRRNPGVTPVSAQSYSSSSSNGSSPSPSVRPRSKRNRMAAHDIYKPSHRSRNTRSTRKTPRNSSLFPRV